MRRLTDQCSRYVALLSHMAREALELTEAAASAASTPVADPRPALSLTVALPAARTLVAHAQPEGSATAATPDAAVRVLAELAAGPERVVTFTGQHRPVYRPLAAHLALRALALERTALDAAAWRDAQGHVASLAATLPPTPLARQSVALVLWQALCRFEAAALLEDDAMHHEATQGVDAVIAAMPDEGALHARSADDQPDHWTYRELSGLHALTNLALAAQHDAWRAAVDRVTRFHLEHTQPDYTTYEPWAVHAFLRDPTLSVFADQQLHDVQTHRHVSGPSVALLPALLLADAGAALAAARFDASA